jgi:hypothetical protein
MSASYSTTYLQNIFHANKYLVSYSQNACENTSIPSHKISVKNNHFVPKNYSLQYQISCNYVEQFSVHYNTYTLMDRAILIGAGPQPERNHA